MICMSESRPLHLESVERSYNMGGTVTTTVLLSGTPTRSSSVCLTFISELTVLNTMYRGVDKSLARPGRKQATATEDFDVHISYL